MAILVTGGARSGKSAFAEQYAIRSADRGIYIATCQAYDEEMKERIGMHRQMRDEAGFTWETFEEPFDVAKLLGRLSKQFAEYESSGIKPPVVLLDCLTLWLSNWLLQDEQEPSRNGSLLREQVEHLLRAIQVFPYKLIVVTNEVGDGIVPSYPLGRVFRDEAGRLNQQVAAICDRVFLVTAGIPIELKARAFSWEQL